MKRNSGEKIGKLAVVRTVADLRRHVAAWHRAGDTVALVPTMGALHAGHLALVTRGKELCDRAVVSIFVNPTQFGPNDDFTRYPRDEAGDAAKLVRSRCDLLYAPGVGEMYPAGFATTVTTGAIAERLDGHFRPGHFAGVATVVTKLLLQAQADVACFGEKDYQQLHVIHRCVCDLDIAIHIEGVPTVREPDGLAMSSRNAYLTPPQRAIAPALHRMLRSTAERLGRGETSVAAAMEAAIAELLRAGFSKIDYVETCDVQMLLPLDRVDRPGRILAAAWLGTTRLIDNVPVLPAG
jgi:pantoate--beta-alanine ligase